MCVPRLVPSCWTDQWSVMHERRRFELSEPVRTTLTEGWISNYDYTQLSIIYRLVQFPLIDIHWWNRSPRLIFSLLFIYFFLLLSCCCLVFCLLSQLFKWDDLSVDSALSIHTIGASAATMAIKKEREKKRNDISRTDCWFISPILCAFVRPPASKSVCGVALYFLQ